MATVFTPQRCNQSSEAMQVRRETLKPPHRLWIAIRSHSDVMHAIAYIDT
jgi:hypothetical protein